MTRLGPCEVKIKIKNDEKEARERVENASQALGSKKDN